MTSLCLFFSFWYCLAQDLPLPNLIHNPDNNIINALFNVDFTKSADAQTGKRMAKIVYKYR